MASDAHEKPASERRRLSFHSLDDILADVDRLAKCREVLALGNWSPGQNFKHLTLVMEKSIDGFHYRMPPPVRMAARLLIMRRFLKRPMPAGFKLPAKANRELGPTETSTEEGVAGIRRAIERLKSETERAPHPVFGPMTVDQWNQLHCQHAALHLSFLVPLD